MTTLILPLILLAAIAFAQDGPPVAKPEAPKSAALSELQSVKLENLTLRQAMLSQEMQKLYQERNQLIGAICKETGIEPCQISQDLKTATEIKPAPQANRPPLSPGAGKNRAGPETPSQPKENSQ